MAAARGRVDEEAQVLREGMRINLAQDLDRVARANGITLTSSEHLVRAQQLEAAAHGSAQRRSRAPSRQPYQRLYAATMRALGMMLSVQTGPFPDDVLALNLAFRLIHFMNVVKDQNITAPA